MTDPKPPRPEVFPPPLPGSFTEPFPKAKSDPPVPEFRMQSTPPSGSLLLNKDILRPSEEDPRDTIIRELRQTIVLYREKLTAAATAPSPSPIPAAPMSKRQAAGQAVALLGKWTTITMGVLGLAATVAHQFRPDLEGPIQFLIKLLGGTP